MICTIYNPLLLIACDLFGDRRALTHTGTVNVSTELVPVWFLINNVWQLNTDFARNDQQFHVDLKRCTGICIPVLILLASVNLLCQNYF